MGEPSLLAVLNRKLVVPIPDDMSVLDFSEKPRRVFFIFPFPPQLLLRPPQHTLPLERVTLEDRYRRLNIRPIPMSI